MSTRRTRLLLLLLVSAAISTVVLPSADADEPRGPNQLRTVVDRHSAETARSSGPGVALAVVRGGVVQHESAAGQAGAGRPLGTDTPMRIESLSKSFTATAVLQLVESGRVRLDEPVVHRLPEFRIADPRGADITVRQLLTHSSGLDDAHAPNLYDGRVRSLEQAVARLRGVQLAADPGTTFAYHNPNYQVLARMVEVVSGQPFGRYLAQRVFAPAGMHDTVDVATSDERVPGMAAGHLTAFGRPVPYEGPGYFNDGSGGVVSTVADLARWVALQQRGGLSVTGQRVLRPESVAEMHRPQSPQDSGYGFGWYTAESAEGPPVRTSHSGAGSGFSAYQGIFPQSGLGVVVLINHGAGLTAADPGVVAQNLLGELDTTIPPLRERGSGLPVDLVLAGLTVLVLAWTVWAVRRAGRWGLRRAARPWVAALLLLPQVLGVALVLSVPSLQLALTQRTAPWSVLFSVEPVAVVLLACLGVGSVTVLLSRLVATVRVRSRPEPVTRSREAQ